jgi:predicted O-methyltransferase YrrM
VTVRARARHGVTRAKEHALRLAFGKRAFAFWQRRGWSMVPIAYDQPIPNVATLPDRLWEGPRPTPGLDLGTDRQLVLLAELADRWGREYGELAPSLHSEAYGPGDAELLWAMIRHLQPRRVVEIGSGGSTRVMRLALERNVEDGAPPCHVTVIDPVPRLDEANQVGIDELIRGPVQDVGLEVFEQLGPSDLLFIDSSHVASTGSDVVSEYLSIVPSIAPGVVVHSHDVFLPYEYPRSWLADHHVFFTEQYLLQALLSGNPGFRVLLATHHLDRSHPEAVAAAIPSLAPGCRLPKASPCSFWYERTTEPFEDL